MTLRETSFLDFSRSNSEARRSRPVCFTVFCNLSPLKRVTLALAFGLNDITSWVVNKFVTGLIERPQLNPLEAPAFNDGIIVIFACLWSIDADSTPYMLLCTSMLLASAYS